VKLQKMSPKQRRSILESNSRLNLWSGSVRSGKTIASVIRWIHYVAHAPPGNLLMVGKTERTLRRNILDVIMDIVGPENFKITSGLGECMLYGRKIYLAGANDERSESKIRGVTLLAAYGDEITLWPESFFTMLLSRLSEKDAKFFGTTNPDNPAHWLKKVYIDRKEEIGLNLFTFTLDDNLTLPEDYVKALKTEYTGLWYKRYILGLWAVAEGSVYPMYQDSVVSEVPVCDQYVMGVDFGATNPTVYLLLGKKDETWYVLKESYLNRVGWVNSQYVAEMKPMIEGIFPKCVDVDHEPSFIAELRNAYPELDIRFANKNVLTGIQTVAQMLFSEKLKISNKCTMLLEELAGYVWDAKQQGKGQDAPIKINDHACDALRYACMRIRQDYS
jgi:PBSX family phage terminase large subunit